MPDFPSHMPFWFGIVVIAAMVAGELLTCALPALLWALIGRQKLVEAFAWRRVGGWQYLGAALLALGFMAAAQVLVVLQNHVWPQGMAGQNASNAFLLPLVQQHPIAMSLLIPLSAAFSEELLFRGVLQRALIKRMPTWAAIGLGAIVFSAIHLDLSGFVVRVLLGALLGTLVLRSRSIFPAMLTHFVYDAVLLGGTAWDVHELGLNAALRLASRANGGLSVLAIACYGGAGLLLLLLGWLVSVRAWLPPPSEASGPEAVEA